MSLAYPTRRAFTFTVFGAFGAAVFVPTFGRAQATAPQAAPVATLDAALLEIMKAGKATPFASRVQTLAPVIQQSFDLPAILRASVGPRYASMAPAQQNALLQAFTEFTIASYVGNFDSYKGERFDIAPQIRKAGSEDIVESRIVPTSGAPTRLDYAVRMSGGAYKIVDVLVDGSISRVAVQRSDFRSLLSGGDPAPLIASLRSKTADLTNGGNG